jgi:hypothetical protein
LAHFDNVSTGAEGLMTRARQQHDPQTVILREGRSEIGQGHPHRRVQRIALIGTIQDYSTQWGNYVRQQFAHAIMLAV